MRASRSKSLRPSPYLASFPILPNRPSRMDRLDRKTLHRLWREHERTFGVRLKKNWLTSQPTGFGQSKRVDFTIQCKMGS